ncbi:hypothetical protein M2390_001427 [Mycetocola sp. BIGb0189]|nr:hypothetical protein [Mycetocola sp. BIGb0189]
MKNLRLLNHTNPAGKTLEQRERILQRIEERFAAL